MKYVITFFLMSVSLITVAQSVVYQGFEADSAAEPRGGMPFLGTFLQANLRKPLAAEATGKGGRVILTAIIEPDGQPTDVKILQAFRPDCGREAVRVFCRFKAWKPAYKDGKPVRQVVSVPVTFPANEPFIYESGAKITYYDADQKILPDSSERVKYKQITPIDSTGFPTGNIVAYELKRKGWSEMSLLLLLRLKESWTGDMGESVPVFSVGHKGANGAWQGWVHTVDASGTLLKRTLYADKNRKVSDLDYHTNGIVEQQTVIETPRSSMMAWFPNGQIRQIWSDETNGSHRISRPGKIIAHWDSAGIQLVTDGTGRVTYEETVDKPGNVDSPTELIETGNFAGGVKDGIWTGRYADGSHAYEERFEKGILKEGKAVTVGQDTVRYTVLEQQPEFNGGMSALGQFLGQNIRYPPEAQKMGAQGSVLINFVVNTDGTVSDAVVVRGVHPDVDQEALRVVKRMSGKWTPGVQRGRKVRVKYTLPINFSLN